MFSRFPWPHPAGPAVSALLLALALVAPGSLTAQAPQAPGQQAASASSFQGSVATGECRRKPLDLTLDDAIQRGLRTTSAHPQRHPDRRRARPAPQRIAGPAALRRPEAARDHYAGRSARRGPAHSRLPQVIGPFGYTDLRASPTWSLINIASMRNYLAAIHNFTAAALSAQDARDMVVLTVGNAYLLAVADETQIASVEAQVATAKVSLDQAAANHQAGTAPLLDELRARVDSQSIEQQLIAARNALAKDKLALARAIGLPLAQSFNLSDKAPLRRLRPNRSGGRHHQARANRKDLRAGGAGQGRRGPAQSRRRRPPAHLRASRRLRRHRHHPGHSHGTGDATGTPHRSAL